MGVLGREEFAVTGLVTFCSQTSRGCFNNRCHCMGINGARGITGVVSSLAKTSVFGVRRGIPCSTGCGRYITRSIGSLGSGTEPRLISLPGLSSCSRVCLNCPGCYKAVPVTICAFLRTFSFANGAVRPFYARRKDKLSGAIGSVGGATGNTAMAGKLPIFKDSTSGTRNVIGS